MHDVGTVGIIDFDTAWRPSERRPMREAKQNLDKLGVTWTQSGAWLKIRLTSHAALYFAPGTGSLRFEKGRIFSSQGLPLALKIMRDYL